MPRPRPTPRRRREPPSPSPGQVAASIFGNGVSNIIPGEVLVQIDEDVAARITTSIHTGPTRGMALVTSTFGVGEIDSLLKSLRVTSISRLHSPVSATTAAIETAAKI